MPMPNIVVPQFPNVPPLPGVPTLLRAATGAALPVVNGLLINAGLGALALGLAPPAWGVFDDDGAPVAIADTVRAFAWNGDTRISDYPQEDGGFESYNKVLLPYAARVVMTCGRSEQDRAIFLSSLQDAKNSTDLYNIVTPEVVYPNANITGLNYRRETKNGATMLTVELLIEEVRVTAIAAFADVKNPAAADTQSQGQVQSQVPSAGMASLFGPASVVQGIGSV
ncbi:hypothetical protein SAMN05445504_2368 [Burkholderia sp. CF099]|nr:hypothetical protein SAMN05445504_2368 [Burkholderia sp. CF099]